MIDLNYFLKKKLIDILRVGEGEGVRSNWYITSTKKVIFVNRNAQLNNIEERYKQQTLTLDEYLEKVMQLIGIKEY